MKLALAATLAFWSLAGMLHAVAIGWVSLALFRFLLGLGERLDSPAGVKAITEWIPPRERGLSMAVFSNGNIFGAILAPPLVSFLAIRFGWQWSVIVTGLAGFALLLVWWRLYSHPEHRSITPTAHLHPRTTRRRDSPAPRQLMWALLRHSLCLGFFLARFLTDPTAFFLVLDA